MAVRDFEAFIRERAVIYDPNLDINPGSPFDVQVVQPTVRRLGTDPFSVDVSTFISERMLQAFPDLANQEEDAITDLLNKPATLLWDPIVREVFRVRQNLSFADPTLMNSDEADSLGANFFSTRKRGQFSRGPGRILFQNPQNVSISPVNFFTSRGGLHFFPTETQSIRTEEMILNLTADGLYYFDVNLVAEGGGVQYNIGPNELISVANVPSATRVTNIRRFTFGETEETAQAFISRVKQELGERSLVTLRGVSAKLVNNFPEVQRLNVIGFNDPEMNRDVIQGGGLGSIIASGLTGEVTTDGEGAGLSRRFSQSDVDFVSLLGTGDVTSYVLTTFDAFGTAAVAEDLSVRSVVDSNTLDVDEQVMVVGSTGLTWTVRKRELTLSKIPGGILFPNTAAGELVIADDEIHIGGMYDTYVRGSGFDELSFTIDAVVDDEPLLSGLQANTAWSGSNYVISLTEYPKPWSDELIETIERAVRFGYSIELQDPPQAGTYRILGYGSAAAPTAPMWLIVEPQPTAITSINMRWRLFDVLNVDLLNPRETRISGSDLSTLQNSDIVNVPSGTDFDALGVSEGDVLNIGGGASAGDYTIAAAPLSPTSLQLDTTLGSTGSNLTYTIYRPNTGGSLEPPFVRLTKVELLDSSGQPVGTTVPYARPVDVQTRAFQNPARGVKHDFRDALLGIVSRVVTTNFGNGAGETLDLWVEGYGAGTITLTTANANLATAISELNASFETAFGIPDAVVQVGVDRLGIRSVGTDGYVAITGGTGRISVFGDQELRTTGDVRVDGVNWSTLSPAIDTATGLDVVQVLDGFNIGFYPSPFTLNYARTAWPSALPSSALLVGALDDTGYLPASTFSPAQNRRVQVGARSIGSARVYFLEPTSFEVDDEAVFTLDLEDEGVVRFVPDPTLEHQQIPPLPGNDTPVDGVSAASTSDFSSASQDFVLSGIQVGDKLVVKNIPIAGTVLLADPVVGLGGLTLVFSLDGEADRTVTFVRDDASLNPLEVSRAGVVQQINQVAGDDIVELTGDFRLQFITPRDLVVRGSGTANSGILGNVDGTSPTETFGPEDQDNASPHAGTYTIQSVAQTQLTIDGTFGAATPYTSPITDTSFEVYRVGLQRISASEMAENEAEADLYYFDVELISEGAGDLWNIDSQQQLTVEGYRSDGYYVTTEDSNLTFSEVEEPKMVLSRYILEEGVDDDPVNATQLTNENIQVTYERSQLISDIQGFLSAETERVICANPLSRHLIPHFVRFDLEYVGGSRESIVLEDIEEYIKELSPVDTMDSSDIQKLVTDRGATYVRNPLDLIAVVHNVDRTVWVQRSQDQLSTGRLSAFISEAINLTRDVTGGA